MTGIVSNRIEIDQAKSGVREVIDYWQSKRQGDAFPSKSDIEPWDIQEKLGRICLLEVQPEPLDFIYRLDGSNIASAVTVDMTGRAVTEITPEIYGQTVHHDLSVTVREKEPTLWLIALDFPPASYRYQRVILPLGNQEQEIHHLMTFSYCLESPDGMFPWNRSYGKPS